MLETPSLAYQSYLHDLLKDKTTKKISFADLVKRNLTPEAADIFDKADDAGKHNFLVENNMGLYKKSLPLFGIYEYNLYRAGIKIDMMISDRSLFNEKL